MRITVFCHNYPPHPGGLEIVVRNISAGLAERHNVVVVTSGWAGSHGRSVEDGMVVHRLQASHFAEMRGVPYPLPWGPGLRAARRDIGNPDIVHCHGALYAQSLWAQQVARSLHRPLVLTEHVGFVDYRGRTLNRVQRLAWRLIGDRVAGYAEGLIVYNERVRAMLEARYPHAPLHFIRNGVDVTRFRPADSPEVRRSLRTELGLPPDDCLVLFAGRDVAKKNLRNVLGIPRDGFSLVVCGARRRLHEERVVDLGIVPHDDMPPVFAAVDLLVHASAGEGFPLAIQEAMASGLPVALLWDPGYEGNVTSDVVDIALTMRELAGVVRRLVAQPDRRAELGARARNWAVEHWSWRETVHAYEALFDHIANDVRQPRAGRRT